MRVGILGGGQLGRMLALEGYPLGLSFRFLEPHAHAPVHGLGEMVVAPYDDMGALERFARDLDVATYEFENVPVASARALAERVPVLPPPTALQVAQDRLQEKRAFDALGIPTAPWASVDSPAELDSAAVRTGLPAVLKPRHWGYDGKGQAVIRKHAELEPAWRLLGGRPLIIERFVEFSRELSILGVRARDGHAALYPLVENEHRGGVLYLSVAPAPLVDEALQGKAEGYALALMERLDYVGVMALELFQEGDALLANELAPRVHNSGHWTLDGAWCSQFENHLRAVCGYPLGPTEARGYSAMLNLLGRVPPAREILALGGRLHLYGKEPRPGRKLGHVNVLGADPGEVRARVERIEGLLEPAG